MSDNLKSSQLTDKQVESLARALEQAQHIVVMTGAGVSADSGIDTFRGKQNSLWAKYDPVTLASPEGFAKDPETVWQWYQWRRQQIEQATPNATHNMLAKLAERFSLSLITQNVDGLHHRAGSQQVAELHGNITVNRCNGECCDYQSANADSSAELSLCPQCKEHYLRPGVVWFGESLDENVLSYAEQAAQKADLFLSVGTSSQVYPAAGFAHIAKSHGATLIEINPQATALTSGVDLAIAQPAAKVFSALKRQ
ncbi:SIR2 family NAD-dependent protein deacylase [Pleionea mediterranea]|uniref:NAD-dependent protein deacylase n=1 Tax=Pleionea mediterranea TaxID=523701 RepID=A0A316FZ59_9GAMM|nr:NAD-dependent deacylase [Pleionea mediterranea]PWK53828.1 NAD-dependent deacetylase [Pleionea mediterranea]